MPRVTVTLFPDSIYEELLTNQKFTPIKSSSNPLTNVIGKSHTNSTYAEWSLAGSYKAYTSIPYLFNVPYMPENAVIESIKCIAKVSINNYMAVNSAKVELYREYEGTKSQIIGVGMISSKTEYTFSEDNVYEYLSEMILKSKIYLSFSVLRNTSLNSIYEKIYGATLTIVYTYPDPVFTTVNKVTYDQETLIDLTSDTITADTILAGKIAHDKTGATITGNVITQNYHTGTTDPESTLGTDGDVYLKIGV